MARNPLSITLSPFAVSPSCWRLDSSCSFGTGDGRLGRTERMVGVSLQSGTVRKEIPCGKRCGANYSRLNDELCHNNRVS